jgi:hypothetical protein
MYIEHVYFFRLCGNRVNAASQTKGIFMNLLGTSIRVGLALTIICPALHAIESLNDIIIGATYHMELTTGDVIEGVVDSKTDTTLVLAKSDGQGVTFRGDLVVYYNLLAPPRSLALDSGAATVMAGSKALTYKALRRRGLSTGKIDVAISNGAVYRGDVGFIDAKTLLLNINGTAVPINRDLISHITTVVETAATTAQSPPAAGPLDTVIVRNPQTDDWDRPLEPIVVIGTITSQTDRDITIKTSAGEIKQLPLPSIMRTLQHSLFKGEAQIVRYAKPLFCPKGMILVDMPPGKTDVPFFKVCIDKYEYPNKRGTLPQGNLSFEDARRLCEADGKRLCTAEEWQWACSGREGYPYPYGWVLDTKVCNSEGVRKPEPSGKRYKCVGKFGVSDMSGNIYEWVANAVQTPVLMGGSYSKCQTVSPGMDGAAKPQFGTRCCLSN